MRKRGVNSACRRAESCPAVMAADWAAKSDDLADLRAYTIDQPANPADATETIKAQMLRIMAVE
jgi:hypothetical protein